MPILNRRAERQANMQIVDPLPLPDAIQASPRAGLVKEVEPFQPVSPGPLRGQLRITLQTRHAERLLRGRPNTNARPGIIGLIGFTRLLSAIWRAAHADDPYAHWWLIKLDERLLEAEARLEQTGVALKTQLEVTKGLSLCIAQSRQPVSLLLELTNSYALRAAQLLLRFDCVACTALTAGHAGLLTRDELGHALHHSGRRVRGVFASPLEFHLTGVTRRDVELGTRAAQVAVERLGELPFDVLDGTRRAALAPARTGSDRF